MARVPRLLTPIKWNPVKELKDGTGGLMPGKAELRQWNPVKELKVILFSLIRGVYCECGIR